MENKDIQFDPKELFTAIAMLEKERGVSAEYLFSQITKAIEIAVSKNYGSEKVTFVIDKDKQIFEAYLQKQVMDDVFDNNLEISLEKAREINPSVEIGDFVNVKMDTMALGRIGVNAARNVIRQGINEGEKGQLMLEFKNKIGELVTATVENVNPHNGNVAVKIGKSTAYLHLNEQVKGDTFKEGDLIKVYISDVQRKEKGNTPKIFISRTHPEFVKRMFETEVPEIYDGTVEIKSVSREAGSRTKIAVYSKDKQVDAIGACIGTRGTRVSAIVDELNGEKIDIIEYDENPQKFIAAALAPATVIKVQVAGDGSKVCRVTVPDSQLSLAIGNKGQNVRLAARLTGWKIDIRPESGFFGEEDDGKFIDEILPPKKETDAYLDGMENEKQDKVAGNTETVEKEETAETTENTETVEKEEVTEDNDIFAEEEFSESEE
ncbi:MAG: transcription termination/antitermination protein NusA [Clostridia bacterium]|nr:transcription termination/antitermination protein NusA [Clostridia bacterium]